MRLLIISVAAATLALAGCKKESSDQPTDITGETAASNATEVALTPAAPATSSVASSTAAMPDSSNTAPMSTSSTSEPEAPAAAPASTTGTNG